MEPVPFNDWRLVALTPLPFWALLLVALAAAAAVWFAWAGLRSEARPARRRLLVALRGVAAALAFVLVLEPGVELLATSKIRGRVAVVVDRSRSMTLPSQPGGPTRAAVAAGLLSAKERAALESRFQVDYYGFAGASAPLDPSSLGAAPAPRGSVEGASDARVADTRARAPEAQADDDATRILPALEDAARAGGSRPLAGIVLVSDGADNGAIDEALSPRRRENGEGAKAQPSAEEQKTGAERLEAVRERLEALGAPVMALDTTAGSLRDLALDAVRVDDFAFVRNTVEVEVQLSVRGWQRLKVPVMLEHAGGVAVMREVELSEGTPATVKLPFVPDTTGENAWTVRVPVQGGEQVTANNSRSFVLKVIRDRVRVLHVAGRPSYDERFLRMLLKRDPNVDLISFFILRTPNDLVAATNEELSLIPFPTDEIFDKQLKTFDLVVFHNFTYRPYRMQQYLPGIASYVRDGGAFLMLGGDISFSEGAYAGTPIEEILPVALEPSPGDPPEDAFAPRLTAGGRRHPVTQLAPGEAQNENAWRALPPLHGLNRTSLHPEAHALMEHPTLSDAAGRPLPVVAVRDVGRGRSMAVTADSTWMWSFIGAREGRTQRSYDAFFHAAIRWLVRDPELTRLRVQSEKDRYTPGEPVSLLVKARNRDYAPAAGAQVDVQVLDANSGRQTRTLAGVVGDEGTLRLSTEPLPAGGWKVVATAPGGDDDMGRAEDAFVVEESGPELARPAPRPDVLELVADASGGKYFAAGDAKLSDLPLEDPERVEIGQRRSKPMWDRWPVLLALCGVLAGEWFLRRRWGFF